MAEPQVLLGVEGHIAILTLNRPEAMNAMGHDLARDLEAALDRLEAAQEVRAVVATGAAARAFSVGGDIRERGAMSPPCFGLSGVAAQHRRRRGPHGPRCDRGSINGFCF